MRRYFIVPIIAVLFCVNFGAFGATARGSRSVANAGTTTGTTKSATTSASSTSSGNQPVSARVANRARVRTAPTAAQPAQAVSARAAVRNAPKNTAKNVNATAEKNQKVGVTSARAAAKQKAVNMGTKITTATENTVIPEECKTAFDGCMDSFCMLANTSGGRCRCDDRSEELDNVLDQIMKLDSQSKTLAEEGVERLQRGDAVDAIYSMAEDAANKVVAGQKKNQKDFLNTESQSGPKKLDMSAFNSGVFDTDDLFGGLDDNVLESDLSDKKGNALRSAATKMCVAKVPSQCKEYSSMLQLVYAQKIKSDCVAYENDLKQQKMNSENLLKTAQKAVRDAAAEQYASKNKYKTTGECVVAFKKCMLGEDACGSGFSKCVIDPTLLSSKSTAKQIKTKTTTVEISTSTYTALEGSRGVCDTVLAQCVDANKNDAVWKQFLLNVAPELKAAEFNAEDESRRNCAKNVVSCIKEQAVNEGFQEGGDSWYIFTSNPENVRNFCKMPLQKCNAYGANKEMEEAVMKFVNLSLNALRADRCTASIKNCLQRDDNCHKDYTGCIGVGEDKLWSMCSEVATVDCAGRENDFEGGIKGYVMQVAQGLMLSIDSALAKACRQAVTNALIAACGSETDCTNEDAYASNDLIDKCVSYQMCPTKNADGKACEDVTNMELIASERFDEGWRLEIKDKCNIQISGNGFTGDDDTIIGELNDKYKVLVAKIDNAENVQNCISGRKLEGLGGSVSTSRGTSKGFTYLTNNAKSVVLQGLYTNVKNQMNARLEEVRAQAQTDAANLKQYMADAKATAKQEAEDECSKNPCNCYADDSVYARTLTTLEREKYKTSCAESYKTQCATDPCICKISETKDNEKELTTLLSKNDINSFTNECDKKNTEDLKKQCEENPCLEDCKGMSEPYKTNYNTKCQEQEAKEKETVVSANCKLGKCNECDTATSRCKCIAATYFQAVHAKHHGHDNGEVVMLGGAQYNQQNQCVITYRRHQSCKWKGEGKSDAGTGWNCEEHDDVRLVTFDLTVKKDTSGKVTGDEVSVVDDETCTPPSNWKARALKIGNKTKICFHTCAEKDKYEMEALADQNNFGNYFGDDLWCRHDAEEDGNKGKEHEGVTIVDTDKDVDSITKKVLKHAEYKFYNTVESVPSE